MVKHPLLTTAAQAAQAHYGNADVTLARGDEWSIKIFNCSQNLSECARLLVLPKFLRCSQARKANFLFLLVLAKKSQCSRMLAKTIRHPSCLLAACVTKRYLERLVWDVKSVSRPLQTSLCGAGSWL